MSGTNTYRRNYLPCQWVLYASTTEDGIRPRSETSYPFLDAHSRIGLFWSLSVRLGAAPTRLAGRRRKTAQPRYMQ